jgi:putative transposase
MGRSRYHFVESDVPHFMTLTVLNWLPVFTRPESVQILFNSFDYLREDGFKIYAYVILENHLHLIAQSPQLDKDIARFKSFTARQLLKYLAEQKAYTLLEQFSYYKKQHKLDRKYQFWQEGAHPECIINRKMMSQKLEYIHYNPVKRGYVDYAEHWNYSSAKNYLGQPSVFDIDLWEG